MSDSFEVGDKVKVIGYQNVIHHIFPEKGPNIFNYKGRIRAVGIELFLVEFEDFFRKGDSIIIFLSPLQLEKIKEEKCD